jgi:transglutaminase-like putative cysteine protease
VSSVALPVPRRVRQAAEADPRREMPLRLVAFFALAMFCAAHYSVLVADTNGRRVFGLVLLATCGAGALVLTRGITRRAPALVVRVAIVIATFALALIVTGVDARLVLPGHWDELRDGVDRGFSGLDSFSWPYAGGDHWVRLTLLLAMPALVVPAAMLAFWPARESVARVLRWLALALLLVAYGTGTTQLALGGWALRGAALLVIVAAWLWLPRLRPRDTVPATLAVIACGLLALPLAAGLDRGSPWLDYRSWDWFKPAAVGTSFRWDHTYGPIQWSRTGVTLLDVQARRAHYWKAETLEQFDGIGWRHGNTAFDSGTAASDIPQPINQRWVERVKFTVRKLRTPVVVGAGTVFRVDSGKVTTDEPDGTIRVLDSPFQDGDAYSVDAYIPDPTAAQMRGAPTHYPLHLLPYTAFQLPRPGDSGLHRKNPTESAFSQTGRTLESPSPGAALQPAAARRVVASPYGRMYDLARRLTAGQPTTYDKVKAVQAYLQRGFQYSEKPPLRRYPLVSFLFDDKIGYCQQFSGAMALMLRMNGIPTRVATGFTPGNYDHVNKEYRVRDLDAHSWVEVWFTGIGWVPFDPTPSLSPASFQSDSLTAPSAATGTSADHGATQIHKRLDAGATASGSGGSASGTDTARLWLWALAAVVLLPVAVLVLWLVSAARRRPHFHSRAEGAVEELRRALERLGYRYPARTTLTQLERRLRVTAGPEAARYVGLLREQRYAAPGTGTLPTPRDRRALRRALTEGGGPIARVRGLLALPPHPRFTGD